MTGAYDIVASIGVAIDAAGIATVMLNRAERANALDRAMLAALSETLSSLDDRTDVRVIVLRGAGRHFCSGMDVASAGQPDSASGPHIGELCRQLDAFPKPTIGVVQGAAIGAGCALVACCDTVLATDEAYFAVPEVRLGLAPSPLTPFFVRALGARHARRHLLCGDRISAQRAAHIGLVHEVCTPSSLESCLHDVIEEFLSAAPGAFAIAKTALREMTSPSTDSARIATLEHEFARTAAGAEAIEGKASFREKRPPAWHRTAG